MAPAACGRSCMPALGLVLLAPVAVPLLLVFLLGVALHNCACGGARLPEPGGRYGVGAIEVDVPVPTSAAGKVPCLVYYPTRKGAGGGRGQVLNALGSAAHVRAFGANQVHPTWGAWLWPKLAWLMAGSPKIRAAVGAPAAPAPAGGWPTAVWSHGTGGHRRGMVALLTEMASHGAVCIALDHADGPW